MQIIFDRIGRCDGCLHYDGHYKTTSACGGCERNPKVMKLSDCYVKPKTVATEVRRSLPNAPADDATRAVEAANDAAMGDFGVRPAADRRAARAAQEDQERRG